MGAREVMLSTEEAAAALGVSVQYIRRLAKDGRLPAVRVPGRGLGEWQVSAEAIRELSGSRRPEIGGRTLSVVPATGSQLEVEGDRGPVAHDARSPEAGTRVEEQPVPGERSELERLQQENARLRQAVRELGAMLADLT